MIKTVRKKLELRACTAINFCLIGQTFYEFIHNQHIRHTYILVIHNTKCMGQMSRNEWWTNVVKSELTLKLQIKKNVITITSQSWAYFCDGLELNSTPCKRS